MIVMESVRIGHPEWDCQWSVGRAGAPRRAAMCRDVTVAQALRRIGVPECDKNRWGSDRTGAVGRSHWLIMATGQTREWPAVMPVRLTGTRVSRKEDTGVAARLAIAVCHVTNIEFIRLFVTCLTYV